MVPCGVMARARPELPPGVANFQTSRFLSLANKNTAPYPASLPAAKNDPSADVRARCTGESPVNWSERITGLFASTEKRYARRSGQPVEAEIYLPSSENATSWKL